MHIANPIYDVVFRFMMEDEKVAKTFLSAIIREKVVELDFAAQEHTARIRTKATEEERADVHQLTVCRFDFSAKIATPEGGYKTVLIELQKAKLATDIMRFRRYLGINYQSSDNTYMDERGHEKARQIYCIFLLGYDVGIQGCPVVEVGARVRDAATNEELSEPDNEFIQGLHHRSWIVQIAQLKQRRRNDLEMLLNIFDQDNRTKNHHILNVNEALFPEAYHPVIRRLRMAAESENVQGAMELEDDILKELQDKERFIEKQAKTIEEQAKTNEEQAKTIEELTKTNEEQAKTNEEQARIIEEQNKMIEAFKNM